MAEGPATTWWRRAHESRKVAPGPHPETGAAEKPVGALLVDGFVSNVYMLARAGRVMVTFIRILLAVLLLGGIAWGVLFPY
jgi:hypothetical protein